jgi:hypothetical protein
MYLKEKVTEFETEQNNICVEAYVSFNRAVSL